MGAQWKQKHREIAANKRGQLFGKLVKEIQVAARMGGPDPELNARLSAALEAARKQSVPRDTIERAVNKGAGIGDEKVNYKEITFEGFAPHRVPVIVECLTENNNRTAPEIRVLFKAGQLGNPGSVGFLFEHVGIIEAHHADGSLDAEEAAIEADADEVEPITDDADVPEGNIAARFLTQCPALATASKSLAAAGWTITTSELGYVPKNCPELSDEQRAEVEAFLTAIDDHEDVHRVYAALE